VVALEMTERDSIIVALVAIFDLCLVLYISFIVGRRRK